jgi:ATP-dependent protease ClpP protease subunit
MDYGYGSGRDLLVDGCLVLHGMVGGDFWDEGFTSTDVIRALAVLGRNADVTVRINSGGGIATEGSAIHAILTAHKGRVTTVVEGIAASAASIIAMAGDERVMAMGALMMIHDPSGLTMGTAEDHLDTAQALEVIAASMASIYAEATKRPVEEIRAEMSAETWLTAEEAIAKGYSDRVGAANDDEPAPFPFRSYAHAPERFVAMADARGWSGRKPVTPRAPALASTHPTKEAPMPGSDTTAAGASAADTTANTDNVVQLDEARAAGRAEALATAVPRAAASEIAKLCLDGGVAEMTASLLAEGASVEQAKGRIQAAGQIKELVALARRSNPQIPEVFASTMLSEGKTLDQARAALFDQMVARDEETTVTSHQPSTRQGPAGPAAAKANMRAQLERSGLIKKGA